MPKHPGKVLKRATFSKGKLVKFEDFTKKPKPKPSPSPSASPKSKKKKKKKGGK